MGRTKTIIMSASGGVDPDDHMDCSDNTTNKNNKKRPADEGNTLHNNSSKLVRNEKDANPSSGAKNTSTTEVGNSFSANTSSRPTNV